MTTEEALQLIKEELESATERFGVMVSPHEALAIIREEYLEFEREVFHGTGIKAVQEVIQLGAMAARYLVDADTWYKDEEDDTCQHTKVHFDAYDEHPTCQECGIQVKDQQSIKQQLT